MAGFASILLQPSAFGAATTRTWDGGASTTLWATGTNWSGNTAPASGDFVVFDAAAANNQFDINIGAARTVGSITFLSTGSNAFSFNDAFTMTVNGSGGIVNNNAANQVFNSTVLPSTSQTWNAASGDLTFADLTFSSNITLTLSGTHTIQSTGTATLSSTLTLAGTNALTFGTLVNSGNSRTLTNNSGGVTIGAINLSESATTGRTLTIGGTGNTTVTGLVANGTTSAASNLTKTGTGELTLSGNNTYSGTTTVSAGTLNINGASAVGTGTLNLSGGTIDNTSGSAVTLTTNNVVTLTSNLTFAGSNDLNLGTGTFSLGGANRTFTIAGSNLTIGGVVSESSGSRGITKTGAGTLTLTGANTYTGVTTINQGILAANTLAAGGSASSIGNSTNAATNLVINGGTLQYIGAGSSTNRLFTLGTSGGTIDASGSGAVTFSNTGAVTLSGTNTARTFTLTGANTGANTFALSLGDNGSGATALTKDGSGTWSLTNTGSTYTGVTTIAAGTLSVAKMSNGGAASSIGSAAASATQLVINGGALQYAGAGDSSNRLFTLGTGGGTLDASGTGALNLTGTGSMATSGTGSRTLFLTGSNTASNTLAASIGDPTLGATSIVKNGAGTWTLSGTNTHSGGTTLNAGTLNLNSTTALGATAGAFTVNAGTFNNTSGGAITLANNNGQNWNGSFAFGGSNDLNLGTGAVALNTTPVTTITAGTLTVGGTISGSGFGLTKEGAGTLALTATNSSYSGATTINGGTLSVASLANGGSNSSIGAASNAASNLTLNGGTLQYTGSGASTDRLFSVGTSGGTIDASGSGTLAFSNTGALGSNGQSGARTLTLTGSNNGSLSAMIADNSGATTLAKSGTGTWTLDGSASNTYTGTTTVNAGTLMLAKTGGAIAVSGNVTIGDGTGTDTVQLNAANQIASTSAVAFTAGGTPILNLNGNAQTLASIASSNPSAQIQFGSPGSLTSLTVGDSTSTTYAGTLTSGNATANLTKQGTGTLTLSGASATYTGSVNVNNGTLKIQNNTALGSGTAGTTVASGATLQLDGGLSNAQNGTLTLSGTGYGGAGALVGSGGNNRWANNISLSGDATITNQPGGILDLGKDNVAYSRTNDPTGTPVDSNTMALGGNTVTLSGSGTIFANTRIIGTGGVIVNMAGTSDTTWFTANLNTYTGTTTVKNGTLGLATLFNTFPNDPAHPNFFGINGPVVIGDGTGAANSARLLIQSGSTYDEMINFNSTIALNRDGQFSVYAAQSIGGLTFTGGNIDLGTTGGLYLNGDVTVNASAGNTATISGSGTSTLSLTIHNGNSSLTNRVFNVVGGAGNSSDLTISSKISNGSFTKNGAGTMTVTSDNSTGYEGTTTVNNGILNIQNGRALGQADGTAATGTTVNAGGTLQLQGNITVGTERLVLNGTGSGTNGALQNVSGNNTWSGPVIVNNARLQSDAGLLTASGSVTVNTALEVTGSGNTTISGAIGGATGTMTKNGTGTLTLSGDNNYGGATTINQGVVSLQHGNGLGAATAGTTIAASGAALELGGGITTAAEPLYLNGTGISGNGALRNASASNTFSGLVTLQSASLISANTGTSLTLGAGIATAAQALTIGTTANNGTVTVSGNLGGGGSLTKEGSGTLAINGTTNTVGAISLNAGAIAVGGGSTLNTGAINAAASTTLLIASGGSVVANFASGTTTFAGAIDATGGGTFQKDGAGTLVFNHTFNAGANSTLVLNGGKLSLLGSQITFGTIHITGNTTLDFNNSAGTFLSSASLIIDAGVTVTVNNWVSIANNAALSTVWYASNTVNGGTLGGVSQVGGTPLNQITFTNYNNLTTTWVSGTGQGWFDHEIRPTPEPSTYGAILLGSSLALLGWRRWRRSRPA